MTQRLAGLLIILLLQTPLATAADDIPLGVMRINGLDAPGLKLDSIDGDPYDLSTTGGHWRFVHFWASWCGPCRREMPSIQRMMPLLEDTDLEFVIVNTAETEDAVFEFLGIVAPELVPLMDTDGTVPQLWMPRGLPSTFLVDPAGKVQYLALGDREWDKPAYVAFLRSLK
jgi:thiol-disulfide isomerase/thioredoxin